MLVDTNVLDNRIFNKLTIVGQQLFFWVGDVVKTLVHRATDTKHFKVLLKEFKILTYLLVVKLGLYPWNFFRPWMNQEGSQPSATSSSSGIF